MGGEGGGIKWRNKPFPITLTFIAFSFRNITVFGSCQVFDEMITLRIFYTMYSMVVLDKEPHSQYYI